jgi:hypothetical protein
MPAIRKDCGHSHFPEHPSQVVDPRYCPGFDWALFSIALSRGINELHQRIQVANQQKAWSLAGNRSILAGK